MSASQYAAAYAAAAAKADANTPTNAYGSMPVNAVVNGASSSYPNWVQPSHPYPPPPPPPSSTSHQYPYNSYQNQTHQQLPPPPPPPPTGAYSNQQGWSQQYHHQQQQQQPYYSGGGQYAENYQSHAASSQYGYSGFPPPPPPPSSSHAQGGHAPTPYGSNYPHPPPSSVPSLSSSFVPASHNTMASTSLPPPPPPPPAAPAEPVRPVPSAGRGQVHDTSPAASTATPDASTVKPSLPAGTPVTGGIQFTIGGSGPKKSRWGKIDTIESTPVSQTAVATPTTTTTPTNSYGTHYAQQQHSYYHQQPSSHPSHSYQQQPYPGGYSYAAALNSSLPPPPPPPAVAAVGGVGGAAPVSAASPSMLDYVSRSLLDPSCPVHEKKCVEEWLTNKIATTPSGKDWSQESLPYEQILKERYLKQTTMVQQLQNKYAQQQPQTHNPYSNNNNNHHPSSYPNNNHHNRFPPPPSPSSVTGTNNTPLGVRGSYSALASASATATKESIEEEPDFIPFSKGNKKRPWQQQQAAGDSLETDDDSFTKQKGNKKSKRDAGAGVSGRSRVVNAQDLAKVADRASRFASYNAEVARKSDVPFKNPIQRHLFTAERGGVGGSFDDDLDLDWSSLHIVGTCQTLEKRYLRLTQAPDPSIVRPEPILKRALEMILLKWRSDPTGSSEKDHLHDYVYTCDQFKSIRQDLTVQHLVREPLIVRTYEEHARIALEVRDFSEYNQCQTQLKNLYLDNPDLCQNRIEFTTYRILYNLITNNQSALTAMLREIQNTREEEEEKEKKNAIPPLLTPSLPTSTIPLNDPIALAFKVSLSALRDDYYHLFRLAPRLPFLGPILLRPFLVTKRVEALKGLVKAMRPGKVELKFFLRTLGYRNHEDEDEDGVDEEEEDRSRETFEDGRKFLKSTGIQLINSTNASGGGASDELVDTKNSDIHEPYEDESAAPSNAHGVTHALI